MKNIMYIPLAVYLENGGVIKKGRILYNPSNNQEIGTYVEPYELYPIDMCVIERHNRIVPFYTNYVKIQIEVNPIYK